MRCNCPEDCCRELERLREENIALRISAETFGDLAERLNVQLQHERKAAAADRAPRPVGPFTLVALACRHAVTDVPRRALRRGWSLLNAHLRRREPPAATTRPK
jgi:hypothetical protein